MKRILEPVVADDLDCRMLDSCLDKRSLGLPLVFGADEVRGIVVYRRRRLPAVAGDPSVHVTTQLRGPERRAECDDAWNA